VAGGSGGQVDGRWAHPEALKAGEEPGMRASGSVFALVLFVGCLGTVLFLNSTIGWMVGFAGSTLLALGVSLWVGNIFGRMRARRVTETHASFHRNIETERTSQMAAFKAQKNGRT